MRERAVMRLALALLAFAACKPRVIELGRPDGAVDGGLPVCACRLTCTAATIECTLAGSGSTCGSDHFCTGSIGTCTTTSPSPCGASAMSTCTKSDTSIVLCGQ